MNKITFPPRLSNLADSGQVRALFRWLELLREKINEIVTSLTSILSRVTNNETSISNTNNHGQVVTGNPHEVIASEVSIEDDNDRYDAEEVETALKEIAGSGRTVETVKSVNTKADGHGARHTDGNDDVQDAEAGQKGLATAAQITKLNGIEALADVTDPVNVEAAGAIMEADVDAKGDLITATTDDAPAILAVGNDGEVLFADSKQTKGLSWKPPLSGKLLNSWAPISDDPVDETAGPYHGMHPAGDALKNVYMYAEEITQLNNSNGTPQNLSMENWHGGPPPDIPDWYTYAPGWNSRWREEIIIKDGTYGFGGDDVDAGAEPFMRVTIDDDALPLANRVVTWTLWQRADGITNLSLAMTELGVAEKVAHYDNLAADTWFRFYVTKLMTAALGTAGRELQLWPFRHSADAHVGDYYCDAGHLYAHLSTIGFPNEASGDFGIFSDGVMLTVQASIADVEANTNSYYLDTVNHAFYLNVGGDPSTKTIYWGVNIIPQLIDTPTSLDLSGAASDIISIHVTRDFFISKAEILYTEASSADAGVVIRVGKESDDDYYYSGTSEVSKAAWYTKDITSEIADAKISAGDTLTFGTVGGKTGTGEVRLHIELIPDFD